MQPSPTRAAAAVEDEPNLRLSKIQMYTFWLGHCHWPQQEHAHACSTHTGAHATDFGCDYIQIQTACGGTSEPAESAQKGPWTGTAQPRARHHLHTKSHMALPHQMVVATNGVAASLVGKKKKKKKTTYCSWKIKRTDCGCSSLALTNKFCRKFEF